VRDRADAFVAALGAAGISAAVVGEVTDAGSGRVMVTSEGEQPLEHPGLDPFWGAFAEWASEGASAARSG
jgi:hydrogenase expression/formation protein HypE